MPPQTKILSSSTEVKTFPLLCDILKRMINSQELLFIVDSNNTPLDPQIRSLAHKNGLWHRTSGVWVINDRKQILCQKRSSEKDVNPNMWEAFFGGHLSSGEDYKHNAASEVGEELGITVSESDLIPFKILKSNKPTHKEFQYVFALILNKNVNEFNFEKEEISQCKWINFEEARKILVNIKDENWVKKPWDEEVFNWLTTLFPFNQRAGKKDSG